MSVDRDLSGVAFQHFATLDSTNAEAFRQAPSLTGPVWLLTDEQTAGRGRRARPWVSPKGNFFGTLVARYDCAPQDLGLRSFVASLALYDAMMALCDLPPAMIGLKWPNDVLLNGGKISGILLEAQMPYLAIGIGVNLIASPPAALVEPGAVLPVSILGETGLRFSPEAFLAALAPAMAHWEHVLQTQGFAALREVWLSRAVRLGEVITARTGNISRQGIFETIDLEGNLILIMDHERVAIPAADVFF